MDTALIDATAVTTATAASSRFGKSSTAMSGRSTWRPASPRWGDGILTPAGRAAFDRAVADAEAVLRRFPDRNPALAEAVAILERVEEERVDAGGQLRDPVATATNPDGRWGERGGNRPGKGCKATVVEDHTTELLLNITITPANVADD